MLLIFVNEQTCIEPYLLLFNYCILYHLQFTSLTFLIIFGLANVVFRGSTSLLIMLV